MQGNLYERDVLIWSEQQSELLQRLARGERVSADIDWANLIAEVRDVGQSELRAVESLLRQAIVHLLKMRGWPEGPVAHWRSETIGFLADAEQRFTPSMAARIDLARAFRRALKQVESVEVDGRRAALLPTVCGLTVAEMLAEDADVMALAERLG